MDEKDIYRAAKLLMDRHGDMASLRALILTERRHTLVIGEALSGLAPTNPKILRVGPPQGRPTLFL